MKLSKKERLLNEENLTPLHLYELYLPEKQCSMRLTNIILGFRGEIT